MIWTGNAATKPFARGATDKLLSAGVLTNPARIQALQRAVSDNLIAANSRRKSAVSLAEDDAG